jgi:hypothetical protein
MVILIYCFQESVDKIVKFLGFLKKNVKIPME